MLTAITQLRETVARLTEKLREAKGELEISDKTLELVRVRELEWIKKWQAEDGARYLSQPDYGDLLDWLTHRARAAESALAEARTGLERAHVVEAAREFLDFANKRLKHGMIFPEEIDVRLDPLREALDGPGTAGECA